MYELLICSPIQRILSLHDTTQSARIKRMRFLLSRSFATKKTDVPVTERNCDRCCIGGMYDWVREAPKKEWLILSGGGRITNRWEDMTSSKLPWTTSSRWSIFVRSLALFLTERLVDVGGLPSVLGHSLTPCVCGSRLQSLVWQVDEAALLAVAPKHLLFTGSSCVLHGHFSPPQSCPVWQIFYFQV